MPDFPVEPLSDDAGETLEIATDPAYRFRIGESAATGVRRAALGRARAAASLLRDAGDDPAEAIHDARKNLKKLRALLRLVREPLGRKRYRRENDRYRQAARRLGRARDATVRLETLDALAARLGPAMPPADELRARLEAEHAEAGVPHEEIAAAAEAIEAGIEELEALALDEDAGFDLLAAGAERQYRLGREALEAVVGEPDPEAVHEWRKRVKDLWYLLRLLRDVWPAGLKGPEDAAHDLADLLGDHHDLTVLIEVLSDDPGERAIAVLAEARQAQLMSAALPLGRRLYAESPRRFAGRLRAYWATW